MWSPVGDWDLGFVLTHARTGGQVCGVTARSRLLLGRVLAMRGRHASSRHCFADALRRLAVGGGELEEKGPIEREASQGVAAAEKALQQRAAVRLMKAQRAERRRSAASAAALGAPLTLPTAATAAAAAAAVDAAAAAGWDRLFAAAAARTASSAGALGGATRGSRMPLATGQELVALERCVRLSLSVIWRAQKRFYTEKVRYLT